jgi:hypothetical protein
LWKNATKYLGKGLDWALNHKAEIASIVGGLLRKQEGDIECRIILDKKTELQKLERTYRALIISKLDFIDLEDFQFKLQCLLKMPCRFYADDFKKVLQDTKLNSNSVLYQ